jgi:hypothetical protein
MMDHRRPTTGTLDYGRTNRTCPCVSLATGKTSGLSLADIGNEVGNHREASGRSFFLA